MDMVLGNINILFLSENKIDDNFPSSQFMVVRFTKPLRLDRNDKSGGIMLFTREDMPVENGDKPYEAEMTTFLMHHPSFSVGKFIDNLISQYDNILLMGAFNVDPHFVRVII